MAEEDRQRAVKQRYAKTDKAISELNVILVYKKLVQGLVYSPTDCEKHLALDAKPHVSVALAPTAVSRDRLAAINQGLTPPLRERARCPR